MIDYGQYEWKTAIGTSIFKILQSTSNAIGTISHKYICQSEG